MNNLNSVLIEGCLEHDPVFNTAKGTCAFEVESKRFFRDCRGSKYRGSNGPLVEETSCFSVESTGKLAESISVLGSKYRGVRIVGRLKENRQIDEFGRFQSKIVILADHVEFRSGIIPREKQEKENVPEEVEEAAELELIY